MKYFYKQILFDQFTPIAIYQKIKRRFPKEISLLFESGINTQDDNFSFIFVGAREKLVYKDDKTYYTKDGNTTILKEDIFSFLKKYYKKIDKNFYKELAEKLNLKYIDGFVGYIGYDSVKIFEPVLKKYMCNLKDELKHPDIELILPKLVIAFSHKNNTLTLLSSIFDEEYLNELENYLKDSFVYEEIKKSKIDPKNSKYAFSKEEFFQMIKKSKEMIKSGDVFQILMSNRFIQYAKIDPLSFYRILRSKNPSPYMFLLQYENFSIAGSSPEVMVGLENGEILLRPIAGTRRRGRDKKRDKELEEELKADPKERAEHLMLVDLGRNDIGRVAKVGSVKVLEMMRVERYSHVMHLVSDVVGILDEKYDMFDLFGATFTAGTMTGAPKIRAMELIAEFEGLKRGFYSGVVGYFGFDGNMDTAIAIRTSYIDNEKIVFQAGAGVVADSKEELEFLEVQNKLGANLATLEDLKE